MRRNNDSEWFSGCDRNDPWGDAHPSWRDTEAKKQKTAAEPPRGDSSARKTETHADGTPNYQGYARSGPAVRNRPHRHRMVFVVVLVVILAAVIGALCGYASVSNFFYTFDSDSDYGWYDEGVDDYDWDDGDWDVETNDEASESYAIPSYEGDSSDLTIALQSSDGKDALTYTELYERCLPATVSITVYAGESAAYGSGVVLTEDGYILTCAHVTDDMESATVTTSDGALYDALMVGSDDQTDLAVLKIEASGLQAAEFGDSQELKVGASVCAIGDALGTQFRSSLSNGIVSGLNREVSSNGYAMVLIQTTAAVNSGNSGGALFNEYGQVVGIVNMKMSSSIGSASIDNMGLAIPTTTVKDIVDTLAVNGSVSRAVLGISCYSIDTTSATLGGIVEGLWVTTVQEGSDCADAGLMVGDIITAVDGQEINSVAAFKNATADLDVGDTVTLTVWRDEELSIRLQEAEESGEDDSYFGDEDQSYSFEYFGEIEVALVSSDDVG